MTDAQSKAAETPRTNPGVLHAEAVEKRQRIGLELEQMNGRRLSLSHARDERLALIERLKGEVAEYDLALESARRDRDDLIAMDDALAEEQRAIERILVRRAGR